MIRTLALALIALLFTHIFFVEYRPGLRRAEIPYDMKGFHYPLADYAYQSVREGRLPEWDPTMYSGLPFAANIQAALFYPPMWLLFAANAGKPRMSYQSLQDFVFLHVWLGFVLCFLWLRWRRLGGMAALLGACVFALSGQMMTQLQHLGLVAGFAWMPLALWGIDQVERERRWQPLWKVLVASTLCFLAGYTPFWAVFAITCTTYAAARWRPSRLVAGTVAAIAMSLAVAAVQLVPTMEASGLMVRDVRYSGFKNPQFFVPFVIPNFGDFGMHIPPGTNPGIEYLYLGCAGILGIILVLFGRQYREAAPAIAVLCVSAMFLVDPLGVIAPLVWKWSFLAQALRDWYFLGGIAASAALLAAIGLDWWLKKPSRGLPAWTSLLVVTLAVLWCGRLLWTWRPGGAEFAAGWASAVDAVVGVALFAALAWMFRGSGGAARVIAATAMVLLVFVEYKAFGTWKRFDASEPDNNVQYRNAPHPYIAESIIREIRSNGEYRVAIDRETMFTTELRHPRLTTPQGFDPFLPEGYRALIAKHVQFTTDREFDIAPTNDAMFRLFGVRYFIVRGGGPSVEFVKASDRFRLMMPAGYWINVYEIQGATPSFGWEEPGAGTARKMEWAPEHRVMLAASTSGGKFRLAEQFYPGWSAMIDGAPVEVGRCHEALQCIDVPPGEHRVEFHYRSQTLRTGAAISAAACLLLGVVLFLQNRKVLAVS